MKGGTCIMKKTFSVISKLFSRAFAIFSVMTVAICAFGLIFNAQELNSYLVFAFIGFAFALSLSFTIADFIKNNAVIRNTVRFVLSYLSLAVVFFLCGPLALHEYVNGSNKGYSILSISIVFILIYAVCGLVSLVVSAIKRKMDNENKEYESMFDNE